MVRLLYQNWRGDIAPKLAHKAGIVFLRPGDLRPAQRAALEARFARDVWPVLTPLAVDQGHPFPALSNRSLNLAILLHKERQRVARRQTIFATEGSLKTDDVKEVAFLHMIDGTILRSLASADSYDKTDFGSFDLTLEFDPQVDTHTEPGSVPPRQLPWRDLLTLRAKRFAATGSAIEEDIEIQRKLVVPAGTLLLPLLAVPLGVQRSRSVRSRALLVSVTAILVYYLLLTLAVTAARERTLTPVVAMWLPNVALVALGTFIFARAMRDRPLLPRPTFGAKPAR